MSDRRRIAIVGGGPAGAIASVVLAREGHAVTLYERTQAAADLAFKIGESLPPAARPLLERLGVWRELAEDGHRPCWGNTSSWGSNVPGSSDFFFNPHGNGWHLDRAHFERRLLQIAASNGVNVQRGVAVQDCRRTGEGFVLSLRQMQRCHQRDVDAVIDATGGVGRIARSLNVHRRKDDALLAYYTRWSKEADDSDEQSLIEAVPQGWWYTALLPSGERLVMHVCDGEQTATARVLRSPEGYRALLSLTRCVRRLTLDTRREIISRPAVVPAGSSRLEAAGGAGWVAVGDAAATLDPMSSQGLMNAIESGQRGALALSQSLRQDGVDSIDRYVAWVNAGYATYYRQRAYYYSQERRWSQAPFWRQRGGFAAVAM